MMVHFLDNLRRLRARIGARALVGVTFCDACASVCSAACHTERAHQEALLLSAGIIRR
jgi:hypothetical protein